MTHKQPGLIDPAEHAEVVTWSCTDQFRVIVITTVHAGTGYFMLQASPAGLARTSDLPSFNAIQ